VDAHGQLTGKATNGPEGRWSVALVPMDVRPYLAGLQSESVAAPTFHEDWDLSIDQIRYFMVRGGKELRACADREKSCEHVLTQMLLQNHTYLNLSLPLLSRTTACCR
jgi:hypothetical protein